MQKYCSFVILSSSEENLSLISNIISQLFPLNTISYINEISELTTLIISKQETLTDKKSKARAGVFLIIDFQKEDYDINKINSTVKENLQHSNIFTYYLFRQESPKLYTLGQYYVGNFTDLPITSKVFTAHLQVTYKQFQKVQELRDEKRKLKNINKELENDFDEIVKITSKFVQTRIPYASQMLNNIAEMSGWISEQFPNIDEIDTKDIKIAAHLCLIGKTYLPDYLLNNKVMENGRLTNPIMFQVPVSAKEIFSESERFNNISHIIYHIYENLDGSGIPERVAAWQIPLGSRIIRACLDYNEMLVDGKEPDVIMSFLEENTSRIYDNRIVYLLGQYLLTHQIDEQGVGDELPIKLADLQDGMVVTRDITATSGIKILSKGTKISQRIIDIIYSHATSDPILGFIFIKK